MADRKPAKKATQKPVKSTTGRASKGFTADERAAMRERAHELKAAARRGPRAGKADGEADLLAKIAEMSEPDRAMAERLHALIHSRRVSRQPRGLLVVRSESVWRSGERHRGFVTWRSRLSRMALGSRRTASGSAGLSRVARISSAVDGEGAVNIRGCRSIRLARYREVPRFNDSPYAAHWFMKDLGRWPPRT